MERGVIVVTGASGLAGPHVISSLVKRGASVRGLGRRPLFGGALPGIEFRMVDLSESNDIVSALHGASTIVHCATSPDAPTELAIMRRVYEAARRAEIRHFVNVSIVGIDAFPAHPYFGAKLEGEAMVAEGRVPWTIQRATQFHEFVPKIAQWWTDDDGVDVPCGARWRTIAAQTVGARLADIALGQPRQRMPDIGGPEVESVADLVRRYLKASGGTASVNEKVPANVKKAGLAQESLLGAPDITKLGPNFDQWLEAMTHMKAIR